VCQELPHHHYPLASCTCYYDFLMLHWSLSG